MATEHILFLDTSASRRDLLGTLLEADIGLAAGDEWGEWGYWGDSASAHSPATDVSILDPLRRHHLSPDDGVWATCSVTFRDRRAYQRGLEVWPDYETQTFFGVLALLHAYPQADAWWEAYDGVPLLLRRGGAVLLSGAQTRPGYYWDPERQPYRTLFDLPHTVAPLEPR